jgi:glycosyltransferase involved in cell wall biosynthesis
MGLAEAFPQDGERLPPPRAAQYDCERARPDHHGVGLCLSATPRSTLRQHRGPSIPVSASTPQVAVIIPCYEADETLVEAVASVEPEATEVVIVDDGSTEANSRTVLREMESKGIQVVRQEHSGLSAARMAGLAATTSPYVFPLDSDDILEPGALAELANALDEHPSAAAAWGDLQTFGLTNYRIPSVPALDPWFITYATLLPTSSLFRRDALNAVGGWQLQDPYEDWDLWMALAERGFRGVYVPRVVYRYRRRTTGMMMASLGRYPDLYAGLGRRHPVLLAEREQNRSRSPAPTALKILVPWIARVPGLSPLKSMWVAQVLAHLFWNGGLRTTTALVVRALASRVRGFGSR